MREKGLHRGIETVLLLELDGQAFAQIARAHAGGIEGLQRCEHRFDFAQWRAEPFGNGIKVASEVAGLVDQIDQVAADHAPHGVGNRECKLLAQMVGECRLGGYEGFQVVVTVLATA